MSSTSVRSHGWTLAVPPSCSISIATCSSLDLVRATSSTWPPAAPTFSAVASPIPDEAPVISTVRRLTAPAKESASSPPAPGIRLPSECSVRMPSIARSARSGGILGLQSSLDLLGHVRLARLVGVQRERRRGRQQPVDPGVGSLAGVVVDARRERVDEGGAVGLCHLLEDPVEVDLDRVEPGHVGSREGHVRIAVGSVLRQSVRVTDDQYLGVLREGMDLLD